MKTELQSNRKESDTLLFQQNIYMKIPQEKEFFPNPYSNFLKPKEKENQLSHIEYLIKRIQIHVEYLIKYKTFSHNMQKTTNSKELKILSVPLFSLKHDQ